MIPDPAPNTITRPYRGVSVQEVDVALQDEAAVLDYIVGREVYRRTEWLVLRNSGACALVAVRKETYEPLFAPAVEARVLAGPDRTVWIDSPTTDVGNATALAAAAAPYLSADVDAYVVQGRYEHINVIWQPRPVPVVVTEVVPPEPAKLLMMARQAVEYDEDLPPVDLVLDAVDIRVLAAANPADGYLLPCRGSGVDLPGEVTFLDTRPPERGDWTLIGCERSVQFHRHFYGDEPPQVDLCPHRRAAGFDGDALVLTKCCLLERGVEVHGNVAVVPWGSNLDEVRLALRLLTGVGPVVEAARIGAALTP
ncbi:MAG: hypothetical protein R2737_11480 [Candidatus Nanopelagicales bacterium]